MTIGDYEPTSAFFARVAEMERELVELRAWKAEAVKVLQRALEATSTTEALLAKLEQRL